MVNFRELPALQELLKYFIGTAISRYLVLPPGGVFPVIVALNLNDSESVMLLLWSSLWYFDEYFLHNYGCIYQIIHWHYNIQILNIINLCIIFFLLMYSVMAAQLVNVACLFFCCCCICSCSINSYSSLHTHVFITVVTKTWLLHNSFKLDLTVCVICSTSFIAQFSSYFALNLDGRLVVLSGKPWMIFWYSMLS